MLFSTGKGVVSLVVVRPDTDIVGYRVNERTTDLALAQARADGVDVTRIHAIRDLPKWAQRRFFKSVGWQLNWTFHGWAIVKRRAVPASSDEAAA